MAPWRCSRSRCSAMIAARLETDRSARPDHAAWSRPRVPAAGARRAASADPVAVVERPRLRRALVREEPLKATLAASGIIGTFLGIRSPGTAYVLLHHYMGEIDGAFSSWGLPRGGTGAVSRRSPAPQPRPARSCSRLAGGADLARRARPRRRARNGEENRAAAASSADLRVTFARLVGLEQLPADTPASCAASASAARPAKVNLALEALPDFACRPGPGPHLAGAISISPSPRISSGPTTRRSTARRRSVRTWTS